MTAYAGASPTGLSALLAAIRTHAAETAPVRTPARPVPVPDPSAARPRPGSQPVPDAAPPEPPGDDVWALVSRAQGGDGEAFAALYDRYVDFVFRYIYFRVGERTLTEDFTSETFLRALRCIGSLSNVGRDPGAWFVTIARNIVFDHMKSSRYRLEVTTDEVAETEAGLPPSNGPEESVVNKLTGAVLLECVKKLGAEQQECIVLRFIQGLSVAETAEVMGKNEGAIKALQHRAIRRLATLVPRSLR